MPSLITITHSVYAGKDQGSEGSAAGIGQLRLLPVRHMVLPRADSGATYHRMRGQGGEEKQRHLDQV